MANGSSSEAREAPWNWPPGTLPGSGDELRRARLELASSGAEMLSYCNIGVANFMVFVARFELAALGSQNQCATRLRYTKTKFEALLQHR